MLAQKSKWSEVITAMQAARRHAQSLEVQEKRGNRYGLLLFLLAIALIGFVSFLATRLDFSH